MAFQDIRIYISLKVYLSIKISRSIRRSTEGRDVEKVSTKDWYTGNVSG